jgi:hypothetical protein
MNYLQTMANMGGGRLSPFQTRMKEAMTRKRADTTFSDIATGWGKVPDAPIQWTPQYNASAASAATKGFSDFLSDLTRPNTNFSFQPVGWTDITSQAVSATQEAEQALTFNESNISRFADMASSLTQADTSTKLAMLDRIAPSWTTQRDQAYAINASLMAGELPKDVQERIASTAAFQTMMGGGYGGNSRAVTAADTGLTSLDLMQTGQQGAMSWTQMLNSMLPQQTSGAQVMAQSGLSTTDAINAALSNADRRMTANVETARMRQTAGIQNASLTLQAASNRSNELANFNTLLMNGRTNLLGAQLDNISNQYGSAMNASNIQFGNLNRPYQSAMEFQGLLLGQQSRQGYGI